MPWGRNPSSITTVGDPDPDWFASTENNSQAYSFCSISTGDAFRVRKKARESDGRPSYESPALLPVGSATTRQQHERMAASRLREHEEWMHQLNCAFVVAEAQWDCDEGKQYLRLRHHLCCFGCSGLNSRKSSKVLSLLLKHLLPMAQRK